MAYAVSQDISIGSNLQKLRKQNKFSQDRLAAKLQTMGIKTSRESISKMERGIINVKVSILIALCQIYKDCSFNDFFEGLTLEGFYEEIPD